MKYYRGDTIGIKITLRKKTDLSPIDLADKTAVLTVDESENPTDESGKQMQITGVVQAPTTDGVVVFTPDEDVGSSADFTPGNYFFDVQIHNTSDGLERQTVVKDEFTLIQDITK